MLSYSETPIQQIHGNWLENAGVKLLVKREDMNHPFVSGNKWWKLKHNLAEAKRLGFTKLLTFGGAYSNHIFSTAAAANELGLETIGIIRGEETLPLNATLSFAKSLGMKLHYVSREAYKKKSEDSFVENLKRLYGEFYLIPEGGTNSMAIKGCAELGKKISDEVDFDYLCLPVGTGGTMTGLIEGLEGESELLGFSVLKGGAFLKEEVARLMSDYSGSKFSNWRILTEFDFGGYAKTTMALDDFINSFKIEQDIPLEQLYTGKMMYGICELIKNGFFEKGTSILAIHTGGLQSVKNGTP